MSSTSFEELFTNDEFADFISDVEDKFLQFADIKTKGKAYFGTIENASLLYELWKKGHDIHNRKQNTYKISKRQAKKVLSE